MPIAALTQQPLEGTKRICSTVPSLVNGGIYRRLRSLQAWEQDFYSACPGLQITYLSCMCVIYDIQPCETFLLPAGVRCGFVSRPMGIRFPSHLTACRVLNEVVCSSSLSFRVQGDGCRPKCDCQLVSWNSNALTDRASDPSSAGGMAAPKVIGRSFGDVLRSCISDDYSHKMSYSPCINTQRHDLGVVSSRAEFFLSKSVKDCKYFFSL